MSSTAAEVPEALHGPGTRAPYFEDFEVGQRFTGPERVFSAAVVAAFAEVSGDEHPLHTEHGHSADGRPLVHGPLGLSGFFGWHHRLGLSTHVEAAFDTRWQYLAPLYVGDAVTYEMTVTRCRRTSALTNGVIGRHVVVRNQHGTVVQEGQTSALVTARAAVDDHESRLGRAFPTVAWGRRLAERLNEAPAFTEATGTWDGTIGLRFDLDQLLFRVYRGRVIDCGPRTPDGPAFTLGAPDVVWTELITGPANDFTQRAMKDQFTVHGNAYEYLRLTRAIISLVDEARVLAGSPAPRKGN
ncbi:MaoC family dehydratase N-terminal domain-containing protein [Amycolatopsis acidiphila]|uniref:Uncharacterized protein n=1 Tax=Amycolatopsis acidiphila TaxID=715473 RepID=A0A558AIZ0_9PSEU|nr:MaoC/PaaZ C-terminal domain-containing protein [Amycolatopsis acidiphila]TVT24236.1 hypothetical protein FNH06_06610 [Amycolatopsis acidiphila]UIJ62633.1 MaoC family dehydratase N-terminal domain-containing protein [Amycolatopsis acidiphila]GHG85871.1 hypothetical protein GCM10017788_58870 [Amycolatopsis acidiphila]